MKDQLLVLCLFVFKEKTEIVKEIICVFGSYYEHSFLVHIPSWIFPEYIKYLSFEKPMALITADILRKSFSYNSFAKKGALL